MSRPTKRASKTMNKLEITIQKEKDCKNFTLFAVNKDGVIIKAYVPKAFAGDAQSLNITLDKGGAS